MFTKRQKHVLAILAFTIPALIFVPQYILDQYQVPLLLFFVLPIGVYIATDPEAARKP